MGKISCLLVADNSSRFQTVSYYHCWLKAFQTYPTLQTTLLDIAALKGGRHSLSTVKSLLLERYDLIIIHQSAMWHTKSRLWPLISTFLANKKAEKVVFFVNEYRHLRDQVHVAHQIRAGCIASQYPQDVAERLYGQAFTGRILSLPNAVDMDLFQTVVPMSERKIDIGFRGDPYPPYLGHNDREQITTYFKTNAQRWNLRTDITLSRDERLNEKEWNTFLNSCRAIIGHEAGTSFIDIDCTFRDFYSKVHEMVPENVFQSVLEGLRASGLSAHVPSGRSIAPRHLEALATKTVQILFPGRYHDLLRADEHYIPLQSDFSNIETVVEKLRDARYCDALAERGHRYVAEHHLYRHRVDSLLRSLEKVN